MPRCRRFVETFATPKSVTLGTPYSWSASITHPDAQCPPPVGCRRMCADLIKVDDAALVGRMHGAGDLLDLHGRRVG